MAEGLDTFTRTEDCYKIEYVEEGSDDWLSSNLDNIEEVVTILQNASGEIQNVGGTVTTNGSDIGKKFLSVTDSNVSVTDITRLKGMPTQRDGRESSPMTSSATCVLSTVDDLPVKRVDGANLADDGGKERTFSESTTNLMEGCGQDEKAQDLTGTDATTNYQHDLDQEQDDLRTSTDLLSNNGSFESEMQDGSSYIVTLPLSTKSKCFVKFMYQNLYFETLMDTGAESSCLHVSLLDCLGISSTNIDKNSGIGINTSNGVPLNVLGTMKLIFQLEHMCLVHDFVIVDDIGEYAIFGMDILGRNKTCAILNCGKGEITFFNNHQ